MSRLSHHRLIKRYTFSSTADFQAALEMLGETLNLPTPTPILVIDRDAIELWADTNEHNDQDTDLGDIIKRLDEMLNGTKSTTGASQKELQLYADGGSRGNPGPSAAGFVILDMEDNVVIKYGAYLGITTNNQAEYQALRLGIEAALKHGARSLHVYMDSMLVINQMKGIYKIRNRDLWPVHQAIVDLCHRFNNIHFTHIPRELNKAADAEVNRALDEHTQATSNN